MRDRLVPPSYLLEKVAVQAEQIANTAADKNPFAAPLEHFPSGISDSDQQRIHASVLDAIKTDVLPAYRTFGELVQKTTRHTAAQSPASGRCPMAMRCIAAMFA